jgi:hypothetical protein
MRAKCRGFLGRSILAWRRKLLKCKTLNLSNARDLETQFQKYPFLDRAIFGHMANHGKSARVGRAKISDYWCARVLISHVDGAQTKRWERGIKLQNSRPLMLRNGPSQIAAMFASRRDAATWARTASAAIRFCVGAYGDGTSVRSSNFQRTDRRFDEPDLRFESFTGGAYRRQL